MFPHTPKKYEALMFEIAKAHPNIQATDSNGRFSVIAQSATPFGAWDLSEFRTKKNAVTTTKSEEGHKLIMLCVMLDIDKRGTEMNEMNGSFVLLRKTNKIDWQDRQDSWEIAHQTAEEILAWLEKYFKLNISQGNLLENKINSEAVGPVAPDNLYGWAVNFSFTSRKKYCVNPEVWGDFLPAKDSLQNDND